MEEKIKIGTRGSKLALWQAYYIEEKLKQANLPSEIVIIETKGDKILDRALSKIGSKGVFTEELEEQLLTGGIDIAVHSAKDLPSDVGADFEVIAFTKREKVNDVLVSQQSVSLMDNQPWVVGTSSTRRVAMLKAYYPQLKIVDMRGNLQTRIRKMEEGQCDALLLAFAGVHRMHYDDMIQDEFDSTTFTPAVGQGSVAIEVAKSLSETKKEKVRRACNHAATEQLLLIERSFLNEMNGGCSIPVFGNAHYLPTEFIEFNAGIIRLDGSKIVRIVEIFSGNESPEAFGRRMAQKVLEQGGKEILAQIKLQLNA